jgi:diguanylate cyclase (GGDEF)-like protein
MERLTHSFSANVSLLRSKASKFAIYGVLISMGAVITATCLAGYYQMGELSLQSIIVAQKSNIVLWFLDASPFFFAFWGQYVSTILSYEAGAMVLDQTNELRAKTSSLEIKLMHDATHDPLTGLPNRILFHDRLEHALSSVSREKGVLAVLILDLDRFKEINDTLGHYKGDLILKQVATRLKNTCREPDTLARLGGDEYAMVLNPISGVGDVKKILKRIEAALRPSFSLKDISLDIQASISVALYPDHGHDVDTLLQRADVAMYVAKKKSRPFMLYSSELDQHSPHRLTLMGELKNAMAQDELVLHFQPKLNIKTRKVREVEALVRWKHEKYGLMEPAEFIPLAERTCLIRELSCWVLEKALQQVAAWKAEGVDLRVAVNLSTHDLLDPEFPDMIAGLLAAHDVGADRLMLEITETSMMIDHQQVLQVLNRLSEMGVRSSVDDFGTGYSSLAYLRKLPISEIKIDKSFVTNMITDKNDEVIVRATIDLAHNLGLEVVAEGVETADMMDKLIILGCDIVQGFYLSKPLTSEDFISWLHEKGWSRS